MQNNFESLDNLELQVQKSSVVQERAGLVAVFMYKQFLEFHQATINTNDTFLKILENLAEVLEYIKQSLNIRNVPVQNVKATVDNAKTLAIVNILWHNISFTSRFNMSPKAYAQKNGTHLFCGRIIAIKGDFRKLIKEDDDLDKQMNTLLDNEIASLYIPAEKNQGAIMTTRHREEYMSQLDAPRNFLLKVIETVCAGGELHKQKEDKESGFPF